MMPTCTGSRMPSPSRRPHPAGDRVGIEAELRDDVERCAGARRHSAASPAATATAPHPRRAGDPPDGRRRRASRCRAPRARRSRSNRACSRRGRRAGAGRPPRAARDDAACLQARKRIRQRTLVGNAPRDQVRAGAEAVALDFAGRLGDVGHRRVRRVRDVDRGAGSELADQLPGARRDRATSLPWTPAPRTR